MILHLAFFGTNQCIKEPSNFSNTYVTGMDEVVMDLHTMTVFECLFRDRETMHCSNPLISMQELEITIL